MIYFDKSEFDSPDLPGSGNRMHESFLAKLDHARDMARIPFVITSGYRTKLHNKKVGGVSNSSHLKGYAADIAAVGSSTKFKIMNSLLMAGFTRIGVGATFIHVDNDPDKVGGLIWTY